MSKLKIFSILNDIPKRLAFPNPKSANILWTFFRWTFSKGNAWNGFFDFVNIMRGKFKFFEIKTILVHYASTDDLTSCSHSICITYRFHCANNSIWPLIKLNKISNTRTKNAYLILILNYGYIFMKDETSTSALYIFYKFSHQFI